MTLTPSLILTPSSLEVTLARIADQRLQLVEERRFVGQVVAHRMRWVTRHGQLLLESMPCFMAARLSGELPRDLEGVTLEDLEGVLDAQVPLAERLEALAMLGALAFGQPLEGALLARLTRLLEQPGAELQLGALRVLRHLDAAPLRQTLERLARDGTLLVRPAAAEVLASLMLVPPSARATWSG